MADRTLLARVSAAQLAVGVGGLAVALARRRSADVGFLRGDPDALVRDSLWLGTAYSAPPTMLAAQLWGIARLRNGAADDGARRLLGFLGAVMVPGYLMERHGREHLRPGGWDPVETPLVVAGVALAAAMAILGHRE